jgi:hypothetical protein
MCLENHCLIIKTFAKEVDQSFYLGEGNLEPLILLDLLFSQRDYMVKYLECNPNYQEKIEAIDKLIFKLETNCPSVCNSKKVYLVKHTVNIRKTQMMGNL